MTKIKTCYSSTVCCSDEFLSMSVGARVLYFSIGFEANPGGEVFGPLRFAFGCGVGRAEVNELVDAGFLIESEGRYFIRDYYVNNNKPKNAPSLEAADKCIREQSNLVVFSGDRYNSPFQKAGLTLAQDAPNLSLTLAQDETHKEKERKLEERNPREGNSNQINSKKEERKETAPRYETVYVDCPKCGMPHAAAKGMPGQLYLICDNCGYQTVDESEGYQKC